MEKDNLFELCKAELIRSNADRKHPFRYVTLSTMGTYPESRVVVKRKSSLDLEQIIFTDSRSPKVKQISNNPIASLLFYHDKKKLQIRMKGVANIISTGVEYDQYKASLQNRTTDYQTRLAPSTIANQEELIYDDDIYFVVLKFIPKEIDILQLGKHKHIRIGLSIDEEKNLNQIEYLVP